MHSDFGSVVAPLKTFGKGGDGLQLLERAFAGIVGECGDRGIYFAEHEDEFSTRMKGHMAGTRGGGKLDEGRIAGPERALLGVKTIDEDLVKAEVGEKSIYRVRVSSLSREEANSLCGKIKSKGGDCFVAKN